MSFLEPEPCPNQAAQSARHGGVVAWWRGGVVAWWRGGVVAWWRGGVATLAAVGMHA